MGVLEQPFHSFLQYNITEAFTAFYGDVFRPRPAVRFLLIPLKVTQPSYFMRVPSYL